MNPFILDCYTKLKLFFNNCSNVDDPEVYYNINEFTDVTLLTKPTINITLQVFDLFYSEKLNLTY